MTIKMANFMLLVFYHTQKRIGKTPHITLLLFVTEDRLCIKGEQNRLVNILHMYLQIYHTQIQDCFLYIL